MVNNNNNNDKHSQVSVTINGYDGTISMSNNSVVMNYENQSENVVNSISITEIINVSKENIIQFKHRVISSFKFSNKLSTNTKTFPLHIYSTVSRLKKPYQLDILMTIIDFDDENICNNWYFNLHEKIVTDLNRPKFLKVFINPIGGLKKGVQMYKDKIGPILDLAEIKSIITITKYRGEAEQYILNQDEISVDGFLCVGGDGMLMELIQGLLLKKRKDLGYSSRDHGPNSEEFPTAVRIGMIPAGSTNTVAYSTTGTKDPITAALHVVLGKSIGLDAISVYNNDEFVRYNVSLMGYGFFGKIIAESETHRWMGPARYDFLGFKNFITLESYYGELKYLPAPSRCGQPGDGVYCTQGCMRCSEEETDFTENGKETQKWVTIRDRFVAINSFLISCRCTKSPIGTAPYAHLGNGCSDLIIIRECPRLKFLQHLLRCASYADHFDLDFVETVRVSEFSFVELPDTKLVDSGVNLITADVPWNCDGEPIYSSNVHCKVHKQIIKIFAPGVFGIPSNNS